MSPEPDPHLVIFMEISSRLGSLESGQKAALDYAKTRDTKVDALLERHDTRLTEVEAHKNRQLGAAALLGLVGGWFTGWLHK